MAVTLQRSRMQKRQLHVNYSASSSSNDDNGIFTFLKMMEHDKLRFLKFHALLSKLEHEQMCRTPCIFRQQRAREG